MLEKVHIRNYRGLYDLSVDELRRVNIIAGKNNAGKTSFLEALLMLCFFGNPRSVASPAITRSHEFTARSPEAIWETWWKPMFSNFDLSKIAEISGYHSKVNEMNLKIQSVQTDVVHFDPASDSKSTRETNSEHGRNLAFNFSTGLNKPVQNRIGVNNEGAFAFTQKAVSIEFPAILLLSSENINPAGNAKLLGKLRTEKKSDLVLETLKVVEPRLVSIEDNSASGEPLIWCDVGFPHLVPLSAMGGGMNRIARLVIAICSAPDGIVLVDEFENGIHHSVISRLWKAVHQAAKEFNVQVIATTHSYECLGAARAAMSEETDWLMHRLESKNGKNRCVTYEPENVATSLHYKMEVR